MALISIWLEINLIFSLYHPKVVLVLPKLNKDYYIFKGYSCLWIYTSVGLAFLNIWTVVQSFVQRFSNVFFLEHSVSKTKHFRNVVQSLVQYTLESEIDVGLGINVGLGKNAKKNKGKT